MPGELKLLGAALIVRDEHRTLARCLASLRGLADEIVVVDTGSVDDSVAIAESFGATVLHRRWDGNFAAARNLGLDHLTSELVLYIDADEYVAPITRAAFERQVADREHHVAYRVRLRSRPGFTPYREFRMWRSRPDIRFVGVMHESVVPAVAAVARREGLAVGKVDLLLEHDGYEGDQSAKHARNLPLLLAEIENDPTRTYLWDHIGRIQADLGDHEASRAAFTRGVQIVRKGGVREPADAQVFADLILSNAWQGVPDGALVAEAVVAFPDDALVRWASALDAMARAAHAEAVVHVDCLLAISEEAMADRALGINQRIQTEWAFDVRGSARFELGDHAGAAEDFARAEAAAPEQITYRAKRIVAAARASAVG